MSQVKVITELFVKSNCEFELMKRQYSLSPVGLSLLSLNYIQYGLLFKKPPDFAPSSYLDSLKLSLSISLSHFYPLSGRLVTNKYEDEQACSIFVECDVDDGARLIHASALDLMCSDIISTNADVPFVIQSFFDLGERTINYDGHRKSLLSIQITELSDGVFLGFSINHCVADGTSFNHFMTTLSELVMGSSHVLDLPIYNFTPPNCRPHGQIVKLPYIDPNEFIARVEEVELRERVFHFPCASIAKLKDGVKAMLESDATTFDADISSFQALTSLIWISITRARNLSSSEKTSCTLLANLRPRFKPPLSQNYFGVFVAPAKRIVEVGQLLTADLCWAASLLNKVVAAQDDNVACEVFSKAFAEGPTMTRPGLCSDGPNPVVMMGSARFDLYGLEFGLGRAIGVRSGYGNKADGLVRAFTGPEGGGSVELQVCLAPQTMSALLSDREFMSFVSWT